MKKQNYAYLTRRGTMKITTNLSTAQDAAAYCKTDLEFYTGDHRFGGEGRELEDGTYVGGMAGGNPTAKGKELFVDADGIRVSVAATKPLPFDIFPEIKAMYDQLVALK